MCAPEGPIFQKFNNPDANEVSVNWENIMKNQVLNAVKNPSFSIPGAQLTESLSHLYPAIKEQMRSKGVNHTQLFKDDVTLDGARVLCALQNSEIVSGKVTEGNVAVVLDKTCFYPAKPGHSSDCGTIHCDDFDIEVFRVELLDDVIIHHGNLTGDSSRLTDQSEKGFPLVTNLCVDSDKRSAISRSQAALTVTLHCLAKELGLKNSQLIVTDTQVGPDRCIAHISSETGISPKNVAEASRALQQFVIRCRAIKSENWPKNWQDLDLESLGEDTMCFDSHLSPYHRTVSYPAAGFKFTNLTHQSSEEASTSPVVLSAAPFPDRVTSLDVVDILDFKKSKNGTLKLFITSGPVAKQLHDSMNDVSRKLQTDVYVLKGKREQERVLREIADGLLLPFRFRWLLKQKKLVLKTGAATSNRYLGLFKEPESFL